MRRHFSRVVAALATPAGWQSAGREMRLWQPLTGALHVHRQALGLPVRAARACPAAPPRACPRVPLFLALQCLQVQVFKE